MLTEFICPDGEKIAIAKCLSCKGCRMTARCATLAYLDEVSKERSWDGRCSVTQCINGTRQAYLTLKTDYAMRPQDGAFRIIGSRGHSKLEKRGATQEMSFAEETLSYLEIKGTFDTLEIEGDEITLIDTKTSGAFAVARALGIKRIGKDVPILDENNQPVLLKSGKNKGQPKTRKEYEIVQVAPDRREWELQDNFYAIMVEEAGYKPTKLRVFAIPRDGGTWKAEGYGITEKTYMIDIPFLPRDEVIAYFTAKRDALISAMRDDKLPPRCSAEECWEGRRCNGNFCAGADACRLAGDNPYFGMMEAEGEAGQAENNPAADGGASA